MGEDEREYVVEIARVHLVGSGRAGTVLRARLVDRDVAVTTGREVDPQAQVVVLCVPDGAIAGLASAIAPGPWVAHISGATPLGALQPHRRRFSLHPLVTFDPGHGPEQLDGAWAAIASDTTDGREVGERLARMLGLTTFTVDEADRPLYHAAASMASNYLVALQRSAARLFALAGAPPEALTPLMQGTLAGGFPLTGPISRGDWDTVATHIAALGQHAPDLLPTYLALADVTARLAGREIPTWLSGESPG